MSEVSAPGRSEVSASERVFAMADVRARVLRWRREGMAVTWWHTVPESCLDCTRERPSGRNRPRGPTPIKWLHMLTHDRWLCDRHRMTFEASAALRESGDYYWYVPHDTPRGWAEGWPEPSPRAEMDSELLHAGRGHS